MIEVRHSVAGAAIAAVDAGLLNRVRKTSIILGLVMAAPLATTFGLMAAAGWLAGIAWSLFNLAALASLVRMVMADKTDRAAITAVSAIKFPLLYGAGFVMLGVLKLPALWWAAGFTWPLFVAVMKSLGRLYLGLDEGTRTARTLNRSR